MKLLSLPLWGSRAATRCFIVSPMAATFFLSPMCLARELTADAWATITPKLTPAGHVGADVLVTFPGPTSYAIAEWGEPKMIGDTITLNATTGQAVQSASRLEHLYKLFDVQRSPIDENRLVPFRTVLFPAGTAPIPEGTVVLRSRSEWDAWIAPYDLTQGPLPLAPPVDFDHEIFAGVFLGETSGGHAVEIGRISRESDDTIRVDYSVSVPAKPDTNLVSPLHAVAIAKTLAPLTFIRETNSIPGPASAVVWSRIDYPFVSPEEPMTVVIRSEAAWQRFLDRVAGERDLALPPPPVDLTNQMLIGAFLGRTPLGRSVSINDVNDLGNELRVRIEQVTGGAPPPPDEFTYPYDFIVLPQYDLPVTFERTEVALPSPPPPGDLPVASLVETPHGYFEVVFQLNGCEVVRQAFEYPELPLPDNVILDAVQESADTVALDVSFNVGSTAPITIEWASPLVQGPNIVADITVVAGPQILTNDFSFPAAGSYAHRYVLGGLEPGLHRFELRVNGSVAGHVFFRHSSAGIPLTPLEAWLEPLLIRPVWHVATSAGALGDLDGDRAADLLEFALGSDPLDPTSLPHWDVEIAPNNDPASIAFVLNRRRGLEIGLEQSLDLIAWEAATTTESLTTSADADFDRLTIQWQSMGEKPAEVFFRLKVEGLR